MHRLALVLALVAATATHAHRPPTGTAPAFVVDDGCAESPMDSPLIETWADWFGLWDSDGYRNPYWLGPVQEGVTTRFGTGSQAVFKSGRAHITIRLDDAYGWDPKRTFRIAARSLASLPGPLMQRLPTTTTLDLTQFGTQIEGLLEGPAYSTMRCTYSDEAGTHCSHHVVVPRNWFKLNDDGLRPVAGPALEHTLIHEFAHVLEKAAYVLPWLNGTCLYTADSPCPDLWSDTEEWEAAMAESACAVSSYATTNAAEDFAESVLAWFGYYEGRQGRLRPEGRDALRERLGKRFGVLNKFMHGRFDATD